VVVQGRLVGVIDGSGFNGSTVRANRGGLGVARPEINGS
jgi:hypothetical protein